MHLAAMGRKEITCFVSLLQIMILFMKASGTEIISGGMQNLTALFEKGRPCFCQNGSLLCTFFGGGLRGFE